MRAVRPRLSVSFGSAFFSSSVTTALLRPLYAASSRSPQPSSLRSRIPQACAVGSLATPPQPTPAQSLLGPALIQGT